ncbi:MAG: bifunctional hydroxymethylpyrimidine kinase/phosphomethylpyrimidine kinase [Candidatus Omnitrophica bacterium]|nr:bifunctional hydroxymethylpyrimidine kinase/phosphomethylpyrimidine kinase [Candidatus Omnitrophota bacterium]
MALIVMGTVALDNLKTPSGEKRGLLGGSASHFSMSASLFTKVAIAGVVGKDFPKKYMIFLKAKGVDVSSIQIEEGKTFQWDGEYKKENFNAAITHATEIGVLCNYQPSISEAQYNISNVFLGNIDPVSQDKFLSLMKSPKFVGLDSMNLWIHTQKTALLKLIKKVDLFVANDKEAQDITGENNLILAAKALAALGPKFIVIKKGEHGVLFYSKQFMCGFPAYPVEKVVDPTGAGDTFAGGLMGFLSAAKKINETSIRQALVYATICSSFNVEGFAMDKTAKLTLADVKIRRAKYLAFAKVA